MPLELPRIDDRRYQQLVDELLARVPVHTPEWTNFNDSDPGVTLVQLYAFLTENLLYRANLIPERNRIKFLQLLKIHLETATAARGLVTINNKRGTLVTETLPSDLEARAGNVLFRTEQGLDVLPVETRVFFKRPLKSAPADLVEYYRLLYASYQKPAPLELNLYETVALDPAVVDQVDLHDDTVDRSLWIAILARKNDKPGSDPKDPWKLVYDQIGGHTLTLGLVPALNKTLMRTIAGGQARPNDMLVFELPKITSRDRYKIPRDNQGRPIPSYKALEPHGEKDLLAMPGVVQLSLPDSEVLGVWRDLDPLEAGVGDLPPMLEDSISSKLITWLRVRATGAAQARILWAGINTVPVSQRERVTRERLADGDGTPDQTRKLSRAPVLKGSIEVYTQSDTTQLTWTEIDDLLAAQPEVSVVDARSAPTATARTEIKQRSDDRINVFQADHEAGILVFGDGLRGKRLPLGARVYASYEFCQGSAGNVAPLAINNAPQLPSGFSVSNPVRTWGGADAEMTQNGEKQIKRFLQHRDRLVSAEDFKAIAWRTPGIDIGRIEVLPAFHPDFVPNEPGSVPGVVTVMAIPRFDPGQPDAPRADTLFLNSLCRYLEPRRLVTTELVVCGPVYKSIWVSIGIDVEARFSVAEVTEAVKRRLRQFLAPIASDPNQLGYAAQTGLLFGTATETAAQGWPLRRSVSARVLLAEAARVPGVTSIFDDVLLAEETGSNKAIIEMIGLELPRVLGISVVTGEPLSISSMRGDTSTGALGSAGTPDDSNSPSVLLPVPIIPESC
ncbi:MAG: hypothetical protein DU489_01775 [Nitrosomonas sp.]|uniref:hypothetical protein n=1 Tax=Nitrosomonas sp. TaxID=42353 RepID=UPI0032EFA873